MKGEGTLLVLRRLSLCEPGALIFGVSDKPDEASLPNKAQAKAGMKPLHHLETLALDDMSNWQRVGKESRQQMEQG